MTGVHKVGWVALNGLFRCLRRLAIKNALNLGDLVIAMSQITVVPELGFQVISRSQMKVHI